MLIVGDLPFPVIIHRILKPVPKLKEAWAKLAGADEGRRQIKKALHQTLDQRFESSRVALMEAMLGQLLRRRLGRELGPTERKALTARARNLRTQQDMDALRTVSELPADALLDWLLGPASR